MERAFYYVASIFIVLAMLSVCDAKRAQGGRKPLIIRGSP